MCFRSQASTRILVQLLVEYSSNKLSLSAALLVTMAEVDSARLTSLERVTTDAGSSAIGGNNSVAIRMRSVLGVENFPRHDNFRDTNDVDFTKEFAESLADRCKSRPTSEMYNATLSKH